MNKNEATRNGDPVEGKNTDEVRLIMGNYDTVSSRNQCTNENVQFIMFILNYFKPLNAMLMTPWRVGDFYVYQKIDGTNNRHPIFRNVCKDTLSSVSVDNNN